MTFFQAMLLAGGMAMLAADAPTAEIGNGIIRAKFYLPDATNGFYQGTRFDWSGVIFDFTANGHSYYGPWFTKRSQTVRDFVYEGDDIVAGPCSSTMGPANEFRPLGYETAKPGETFVKIGVGALKKESDRPYDAFRLFAIADHGKWNVRKGKDSITFTQVLSNAASGYAYVYQKTIRLAKGKSEMTMSHSLKNTGKKAIDTTVYNHNFLVMDGKGPGPGAVITFPFAVKTQRPPNAQLAEVQGNRISYTKTLTGRDVVTCPVEGFGPSASDHSIKIENSTLKAGMSVQGDQPLRSVALWSIRSNISVEPFVGVSVAPGKEFRWTNTYKYFPVP